VITGGEATWGTLITQGPGVIKGRGRRLSLFEETHRVVGEPKGSRLLNGISVIKLGPKPPARYPGGGDPLRGRSLPQGCRGERRIPSRGNDAHADHRGPQANSAPSLPSGSQIPAGHPHPRDVSTVRPTEKTSTVLETSSPTPSGALKCSSRRRASDDHDSRTTGPQTDIDGAGHQSQRLWWYGKMQHRDKS